MSTSAEGTTRSRGLLLLALLSGVMVAAVRGADTTPPGEPYRVVDGRVDRDTYTGWQIFRENCARCHGADATGTDTAPDLLQRIGQLSPEEFRAKVLARYYITVPLNDAVSEGGAAMREVMEDAASDNDGQDYDHGLMPRWQASPDVSGHLRALYAWLAARADGVLGPGVPEVFDDGSSPPEDPEGPP